MDLRDKKREDEMSDPRLRTLVENATEEQIQLLEDLDDILNHYGVREFRRDLSAELARAQGYPPEEVLKVRWEAIDPQGRDRGSHHRQRQDAVRALLRERTP